MYLLRSVQPADLESLFGLASLSTILNLPADRSKLLDRIQVSVMSFAGTLPDTQDTYFTFVLEDDDGNVVGTSAIKGQQGTKEDPHVSFQVLTSEMYSPKLDLHFRHKVLKLSFNYEGPTEIASIILHPDHRGAGKGIGRLLSFSRFLYMACRPERFRPFVIAEMLPPHVSEGHSPLWDALGKKFTGISYMEADELTRTHEKDFIQRLFPQERIYVVLLPEEAQAMIGAVAADTVPAVKLLESAGFKYEKRVDPFDGGPHYRVGRENISTIRDSVTGALKKGAVTSEDPLSLIGCELDDGEFRTVCDRARIDGNTLTVSGDALQRLGIDDGTTGLVSPL